VSTKALNQAVSRNRDRFPEDFMFRLTGKEIEGVNQSQIVTGSQNYRDHDFVLMRSMKQGLPMAGVIIVPADLEIGRAIADLEIIFVSQSLALLAYQSSLLTAVPQASLPFRLALKFYN